MVGGWKGRERGGGWVGKGGGGRWRRRKMETERDTKRDEQVYRGRFVIKRK